MYRVEMESSEQTIHVVVAAADPLVRGVLTSLITGQTGHRVAASVGILDDIPGLLDRYRADVVVLDAGWESFPAAFDESVSERGVLPLVVLLPDESRAIDAWSLGARALLPRDADAAALEAAIAAVAVELIVVHPAFALNLTASESAATLPVADSLTPRELEVIRLLADGHSNRLIASQLGISEHTVKFHVDSILAKLGAHSRTEAVTRAARTGLITL
jgi:DNA-binding NarL/FixJ family response regulator